MLNQVLVDVYLPSSTPTLEPQMSCALWVDAPSLGVVEVAENLQRALAESPTGDSTDVAERFCTAYPGTWPILPLRLPVSGLRRRITQLEQAQLFVEIDLTRYRVRVTYRQGVYDERGSLISSFGEWDQEPSIDWPLDQFVEHWANNA